MTNLPSNLRSDTVIQHLVRARAALVEAKTIQQSKAISDVAAAAEIYARRQKLGDEAIDYAYAVKIEALRKLGELLKETPKAKARFDGTSKEPSRNEADTLADLGIDKKISSIAQRLAEMSDADFASVRDGHVAMGTALRVVRRSPEGGDDQDEEDFEELYAGAIKKLAASEARCRVLEKENAELREKVRRMETR